MLILKVTKNQGFILSLEHIFLEKPPGGESNSPSPPHDPPPQLFNG